MQAEIRSAVRALARAQRLTFQGDLRARQAARQLNRNLLAPAISCETSEQEKQEAIQGARQVARYFVENVLQGVPRSDKQDTYALRFTPHIALGDNETIKNVAPAPSLDEISSTMNRGGGGCGSATASSSDASAASPAPGNTRRRRRKEGDSANSSSAPSAT